MQSITKYVVCSMLAICAIAIATVAMAEDVHFKGDPSFLDIGVSLQSSFCLAGLGNQDIMITLTASGVPVATCTNRGGTKAPGQNPAEVILTGGLIITGDEIQNGQVCVTLNTMAPGMPSAAEAGCPNGNWRAAIHDVLFTHATIAVTQGGEVVLIESFIP